MILAKIYEGKFLHKKNKLLRAPITDKDMANGKEQNDLKSIPINQWAEEDRPREKMLTQGKKTLTDSELIAILLRTGVKGFSAIDMAQQILKENRNSLTELARLEVNDLTSKYKGLGMAKAVTILAALELGNRMLKENSNNKEDLIKNSKDLFLYIAPFIIDLPTEEFWTIYLNQRGKVVWRQRIGVGGLTQTTVDVRVVFKGALEHNAVALVVAHNHPSGNLEPSQADKNLTKRIAEAGEILNIKLMDHVIVGITPTGERDYYSFIENALL